MDDDLDATTISGSSSRLISYPLTAALRAQTIAPFSMQIGSEAAIEDLIASRLDAAHQAWPGLRVADPAFIAYLARRLPAGIPVLKGLAALHAEDLYLACACALGTPMAMVELDRRYLSNLGEVAKRSVRVPDDLLPEVEQAARRRVLVADGQRPARLAEYMGRGPLVAWIQSVAIQAALDLLEARRPEIPLDESWEGELSPLSLSPAQLALRARCRGDLKAAFGEALSQLKDQDRELLRLNLLEGMDAEGVGELLSEPASTAARGLAEARTALAEETRRLLGERLKLEAAELEDLLSVVRSQLDLSLRRGLS
jgi:RNA polymerase sigma-70 factor (ECF subfamily)